MSNSDEPIELEGHSSTAKVADTEDVEVYATQHGISVQEAERRFVADGWTVLLLHSDIRIPPAPSTFLEDCIIKCLARPRIVAPVDRLLGALENYDALRRMPVDYGQDAAGNERTKPKKGFLGRLGTTRAGLMRVGLMGGLVGAVGVGYPAEPTHVIVRGGVCTPPQTAPMRPVRKVVEAENIEQSIKKEAKTVVAEATATSDICEQGIVYLLGPLDGKIKIGATSRPLKHRLKELEPTLLPYEMKVVHTIACSKPFRLEKMLHKKYHAVRGRGEWFALTEADLAYIKSLRGDEQELID